VRRLWASESGGSWTTVGGDAAATVRGTEWLTQDSCAGTFVHVKRGVVIVRNLFTHRRVRLTAGHSYLAKAPDRR
jgi:ferric-dicitrate binding protein FerR (iron transport regulator)